MSDIKKKEKIYQGCFTRNKDGTNKLIEKGKGCICPTNSPFWKYPEEADGSVKTRSQERNKQKVTIKEFDQYFKEKYIDRWLKTSEEEEIPILREL